MHVGPRVHELLAPRALGDARPAAPRGALRGAGAAAADRRARARVAPQGAAGAPAQAEREVGPRARGDDPLHQARDEDGVRHVARQFRPRRVGAPHHGATPVESAARRRHGRVQPPPRLGEDARRAPRALARQREWRRRAARVPGAPRGVRRARAQRAARVAADAAAVRRADGGGREPGGGSSARRSTLSSCARCRRGPSSTTPPIRPTSTRAPTSTTRRSTSRGTT